jgi:hypothetical protein
MSLSSTNPKIITQLIRPSSTPARETINPAIALEIRASLLVSMLLEAANMLCCNVGAMDS